MTDRDERLEGRDATDVEETMLANIMALRSDSMSLRADIEALRHRAEAAERRAYDLAVAIMGGEDAPGYADSIPTQELVDMQRKMAAEWMECRPAKTAGEGE